MAPENSHHHSHTLSSSSSSSSSVLDALYCEEQEEQWEDLEGEGDEEMGKVKHQSQSLSPILHLENDLFCEDEELLSLFSKENQMDLNVVQTADSSSSFSLARREAVEWMLMVNSYYGFSTLTAILSVNYLDRFLHKSPHLLQQQSKPWMIQLAAVTCLSLAAKVEEIDVPLLLDLQVDGTKYMFEAKTIQKMELLVLTTLDWKMNPVTPISFLDHIISRLGLNSHLHREFLRRCKQLLLSIVADSRFVAYLPSVLATATMMQAIDQMEPLNPQDYQNQLLSTLNINKERVKNCYEMIAMSRKSSAHTLMNSPSSSAGRTKREREGTPSSPKGVIDAYYFSSDSSNDSWALTGGGLSTSPSVSSSPDQRALKKKKRVHEECMALGSFVDANGISLISIISIICLMRVHFVLEDLVAFFLVFSSYLRKSY